MPTFHAAPRDVQLRGAAMVVLELMVGPARILPTFYIAYTVRRHTHAAADLVDSNAYGYSRQVHETR